ncbi:MAG: RHS repeat-associated core domain-containing protein [Ilumatobacteraceae bacterium]
MTVRASDTTAQRPGIGCLNNRYHDPTLGSFLSVDPLVAQTGDPYVYGAANPTTYSDPDGLDPDTSAWIRDEVEANGGCTYSSGYECYRKRAWREQIAQYRVTSPIMSWTSFRLPGKAWNRWDQIIADNIARSDYRVASLGYGALRSDGDDDQGGEMGGFDPLGAVGGIVGDAVGGLEQIVAPLTCGLMGINPVSKAMGSCTPEHVERQEQYKDAGEAVCEASKAPVVGSVIPEFGDASSYGLTGLGVGLQQYLKQGGAGGARTANKSLSLIGNATTAVDFVCRVAP